MLAKLSLKESRKKELQRKKLKKILKKKCKFRSETYQIRVPKPKNRIPIKKREILKK
jgi:hypothetical protein